MPHYYHAYAQKIAKKVLHSLLCFNTLNITLRFVMNDCDECSLKAIHVLRHRQKIDYG